jgi:DNA gyrase inhibitor GyrI
LARGFLLGKRRHSARTVSRWVEGEPVNSFWFGIAIRGRRQFPMEAYRCEGCGFVELYASATSSEG